MSFDVNWDINKYKDDHESEEHWQLRKAFMQKWKTDYPEERLVCLARVFANIEFMGCRYPMEVMQEVARLSQEVAKSYRSSRKSKLQRTFVSASTAAEDRARGIKRKGGIVEDNVPAKTAHIAFVPQGHKPDAIDTVPVLDTENGEKKEIELDKQTDEIKDSKPSESRVAINYLDEMMKMKCCDVRSFRESMFQTDFGRMVMLIRPWAGRLWNIQASCQACHIPLNSKYENRCFSLTMNGKLVAQATGDTKSEAKTIVETMAWNRLRDELVTVLVKEQWIAHGDARISVDDVAGKGQQEDAFGTPIENSVATKMMQMMGWKGGGLGADAQGIEEPIKPNLQMVNRAGLGSNSMDVHQLRRAAHGLMLRFLASDTLDLDLVFSGDFSKDERAILHQCAKRAGLASRSYGDKDRFLVVKKKLDPFSLVHAILSKGGNTPKYQVFIPIGLQNNGR